MNLDEFFGGIKAPEQWRVLAKWDEYLRMVERVEALPENQSGTDKSGVERAERSFTEHYKGVRRS